ncbi:MAG: hypothetical protein KZQ64_11495 [gamma proteobacterium symbiont of Bathyaustriella thionipta]|nr:hypothetical protein [gamma proteobacterium symbiont of Bathyaustriella thionipta]MCU7949290.1 hypothetical protein [gamma proteobacterium symbiont of Bathyaustriella thionipta]MCU7953996.1 hypothetical protein [gamma proteobacterium symbiont of Bathyaustriella thionipta]MCU7955893.1 hypothetical protein [gamma proteobacterium symbiont of Bathyaustriella thionipta]MCU7966385.1 hypothetical protein [gamma proteobacterium symbiont of Bathyaustriella thionipta]
MNNKEIGGYFSLELKKNDFYYHKNSIKLNSARNCFEYILQTVKVNKVYVPYYNCSVMLEPLLKTNTSYEFYKINENLEIIDKIGLKSDEYILYVNYFGIKNKYIDFLIEMYGSKLIVDNSQSFFSKFTKDIFSIYSPRKFFGVSDGGYLRGKNITKLELDYDHSLGRISHLIGRIEETGSKYYSEYKKNDNSLIMQDIKKMSKFTDVILSNINYKEIVKIRNKNFLFLHEKLKSMNELNVDVEYIDGPMVYPFIYKQNIRETLIKNKIYVATYWEDVLSIDELPGKEKYLTINIIPLPIDQRYNLEDMGKIIKVIEDNM